MAGNVDAEAVFNLVAEPARVCAFVIAQYGVNICKSVLCGGIASVLLRCIFGVEQVEVARRLAVEALFAVDNHCLNVVAGKECVEVGLAYFGVLHAYCIEGFAAAKREIRCRTTGNSHGRITLKPGIKIALCFGHSFGLISFGFVIYHVGTSGSKEYRYAEYNCFFIGLCKL